MASKEEAKAVIRGLIEKYDKVVASGRLKKYTEEETKKDFILPLFRALGWSMEDSSEVSAEERISKGRVDYGFRINGIPKFFLEAKALKEDLLNEKFVKQAVNYSWHKSCTWAVLTDFEAVRIFNAEWKYSNPLQSHFMTINHTEFIDRIDDLWLVSRESFEQGLLDKKAEQYGKKSKKTSVDKQLLADFTRFRELLSKSVMKNNANRKLIEREEDLDEAIQRFLDRLIFIRNCEDRELESKKLVPALREWISHKKGSLQKKINEIFTYFDDAYNSKIFAKHLCDQLIIEDNPLGEVILGLHKTKDKTIYYDFSAIEADTLGNIYEQYLGHILSKSEKRAKVKEAKGKRKAQGIYYTPTYIVDYIVRNTLGELLKKKKPKDIENIRVLDPACGSGSFLIKAFDMLNEHYAKDKTYQTTLDTSGTGATYSRKLKILKNNIFGVDLDKQAVEIAQLNLLLKVAEKGHRLPVLQENIRNGNSLIDDKEVVGNKAFIWNEEFDNVMKEGGFDVVIGNPPWLMAGYHTSEKAISYLHDKYRSASGKFDLYYCFIELGLRLISEEGLFGMIIPNKFFHTRAAKQLRGLLVERNCRLDVIDFGTEKIFQDATNYSCILLISKKKRKSKYTKVDAKINTVETFTFDKTILDENAWNFNNPEIESLLSKIEKQGSPLSTIARRFGTGVQTGADKIYFIKSGSEKEHSPDILRKILRGRDVRRYKTIDDAKIAIFPYEMGDGRFQILSEDSLKKHKSAFDILQDSKKALNERKWFGKGPTQLSGHWYGYMYLDDPEYFEAESIITPSLSAKSNFTLSKGNLFVTGTAGATSIVLDKIKEDTKYVLGILNSKLISFFIVQQSPEFQGGYRKFSSPYLKKIPVKRIDFNSSSDKKLHDIMVGHVENMLKLTQKLASFGDKLTDERARVEKEIEKVDREIDDLVYKLYGITEKEQKIIEERLQ